MFELKNEYKTLNDLKPTISQYFSIPVDYVFFKFGEKPEILLPDTELLPLLFPMMNSKVKGELPLLKLTMQGNMSTLDYILSEEKAKSLL